MEPFTEEAPGRWVKVVRRFHDGHEEMWWALEGHSKAYSPERRERLVIVTTNPLALPEKTTWYLVTNLPVPGSRRALERPLPAADLAEGVRLYGLRVWVEQSYKQVKATLGWAEYQVRSDLAIRRHWTLVFLAFSFCWWVVSELEEPLLEFDRHEQPDALPSTVEIATPAGERAAGEKIDRVERIWIRWPVALRRVRAWLEPYVLLLRYWRAWSAKAPPEPLQALLDWLWIGRPIDLYCR